MRTVLVVAWTLTTGAGACILWWMAMDARATLTDAIDESDTRMVLNARSTYRVLRALLITMILFGVSGSIALLQPPPEPRPWTALIVPAVLLAAVVQLVWSAVLAWRDTRDLHLMIAAEVRARLRRDRRSTD